MFKKLSVILILLLIFISVSTASALEDEDMNLTSDEVDVGAVDASDVSDEVLSQEYSVNNSNLNQFFDNNGNLKENVKSGDTIKLSGSFSGKNFTFNRTVNVVGEDSNKFTNSMFTFLSGASGSSISNLKITNENNYVCGVFLNGAGNCVIQGCTIVSKGASAYPICLGNDANYNNVTGNSLKTYGESYGHGSRSTPTMVLSSSHHNYISSNSFSVEDANAIYLSSYSGGPLKGGDSNYNLIFNNTIQYNILPTSWSWAIQVMGSANTVKSNKIIGAYRGITTTGVYNKIIGNEVINLTGADYNNRNVEIGGEFAIVGSAYTNVSNNKIINAKVISTGAGISVIDGSVVENNYVDVKYLGRGITAAGNNVLIQNNNISTASGVGVYENDDGSGLTITRNNIYSGSAIGVLIEKVSSKRMPSNVVITYNKIVTTNEYAIDASGVEEGTGVIEYNDIGDKKIKDPSGIYDASKPTYRYNENKTYSINVSNIRDYINVNGNMYGVDDGDILIFKGTFSNEVIYVNKAVKIVGDNATFLNSTFKVTSGGVWIENLTIINKKVERPNAWGIYVNGANGAKIINNVINVTDPNAAYAIYVLESSYVEVIGNTLFSEGDYLTFTLLAYSSEECIFKNNVINTLGTGEVYKFSQENSIEGKIYLVNGTEVCLDGKNIIINGTTYCIDGNELCIDGVTYCLDGNELCIDGVTYCLDGSELCIDGVTYCLDGSILYINGTRYNLTQVSEINGTSYCLDGDNNLVINGTTYVINGTDVCIDGVTYSFATKEISINGTTYCLDGSQLCIDGVTYSFNGTEFCIDGVCYCLDGTTLCIDGVSYSFNGTELCIDGVTYCLDGTTLCIDGAYYDLSQVSEINGTTYCIDGNNNLVINGTTYCLDGNELCIDGVTYCLDGNELCIDGVTYCLDGGELCIDGVTYCLDGNVLCIDGVTYCLDGNELVVTGANYGKTSHVVPEIYRTYGILLLYSSSNDITANTVNVTSKLDKVYPYAGSNSSQNSIVGIDAYYNSHDNIFLNNIVTVSSNDNYIYGMGVLGSPSGHPASEGKGATINQFIGNNITLKGPYSVTGIIVGDESKDTILRDNIISIVSDAVAYGITLESSQSTTIKSNSLTLNSDVGFGIEGYSSGSNVVDKNIINANGKQVYGMIFSGPNNNIKDNDILANGTGEDVDLKLRDSLGYGNAGIYLSGNATNNLIQSNNITSQSGYAIVSETSGNTIMDNYLQSEMGNSTSGINGTSGNIIEANYIYTVTGGIDDVEIPYLGSGNITLRVQSPSGVSVDGALVYFYDDYDVFIGNATVLNGVAIINHQLDESYSSIGAQYTVRAVLYKDDFKVTGFESNNLVVTKGNLNVEVTDVYVKDGITGKFTAKVTNGIGKPVSGLTVRFYDFDTPDRQGWGNAITDSNGIATLTHFVDENFGEEFGKVTTITAVVRESEYYAVSNGTSTLTILDIAPITITINSKVGSGGVLATIVDNNGLAVANKQVSVSIDGKSQNVKTNANGEVILPSVSGGSHNVVISSAKDSLYDAKSASSKVTVVPAITGNKDANVYFGNTVQYKIRLADKKGNYLKANNKITIKVNGKNVNLKTDSSGYVSYSVKKVGTYTINAEYNGYKVSNKIVIKSTLTAKDITKKKAKKIKFSVKVVDKKGRAVKKKKVTFKLKGKKYTAKTNKKGVATVTLKNLKVGKYTITSSYGGCTIKNTIKIKK